MKSHTKINNFDRATGQCLDPDGGRQGLGLLGETMSQQELDEYNRALSRIRELEAEVRRLKFEYGVEEDETP
jgi:hypothetical protein